nr:F-box only protein 25 isoform X3 [Vicugna pacos]
MAGKDVNPGVRNLKGRITSVTSVTACFYREKWIYVHKESTRERHGYCTLGEAFNRLDFSSAIQDTRRFNYVVRLLQLIAKSQLTSLSGVAQKNYFHILDKIVQKVLSDHQNPRLIKDLLQDLSSTLCILIRGVGKSVLVGNINIWICRLETVLSWQQQLQNLQMAKHVSGGLTLSDLPVHMLNNILYRLSDGWDIVTLGQVTPTLAVLSEDRRLWKKLCQYHFAEKQFCRHLILSEKGHIEWKLMYFALQKYYPTKEQYGDTLHFCRHCSILFWKSWERSPAVPRATDALGASAAHGQAPVFSVSVDLTPVDTRVPGTTQHLLPSRGSVGQDRLPSQAARCSVVDQTMLIPHLLMHLSCFHLLAAVNMVYKSLFYKMIFFPLGLCLEVDLLDHVVIVCLIFSGTATFSQWRHHFTFLPTVCKGSISLHPHKHLLCGGFWFGGHPDGDVTSHCGCELCLPGEE